MASSPLDKVTARRDNRAAYNLHILDDHDLPIRRRHSDIHTRRPEAAGILKEVISLPRCSFPRLAPIGADVQCLDLAVRIDDLHAKPPLRGARFESELDGRSDRAGDDGPGDGDHAFVWIVEFGEGVGEEVEVVGAAAGAFVDDLPVSAVSIDVHKYRYRNVRYTKITLLSSLTNQTIGIACL